MNKKLVIQKANTGSPRLKMESAEWDIGARCKELKELLQEWDASSRVKLWRYIRLLRMDYYLNPRNRLTTSTIEITANLQKYDPQRQV